MKRILILAAACTATLGTAALAQEAPEGDEKRNHVCAAEVTSWASREAVVAMAGELGLSAERISLRGSCFIVMGEDEAGEKRVALLNAETLEHLEMPERRARGEGRMRGPKRGDHHAEGRRGEHRGGMRGVTPLQPATSADQ